MAASKSGDSKQGLIIALVVFVILTIGLGVTTWLGYSDQEALRKKEKDAKDAEAAVTKDRNWYKFQATLLKEYLGVPDSMSKNDHDAVVQLRDLLNNPPSGVDGGAELPKLREWLSAKPFGWSEAEKKPTVTIFNHIGDLNKKLKDTQTKLDQTEQALKQAKATYDSGLEAKEGEVATLKADYEKAKADNLKDSKDRALELETRVKDFQKTGEDLEATKKKAVDDVAALQKKQRSTENLLKNRDDEIGKLKVKVDKPDFTKYDTPKGKLTQVDARRDQAWINLGSADGLLAHQNLTFSVFGADKVRKGSIEVADVLSPHLSAVKITDVVDAGFNPMVKGDDIVNPLWTPGMKTHVAVAGIIDLNDTGVDRSEDLLQALQQQGIAVDAYLDLRDGKIKGNGITSKTEYLILGDSPQFGSDAIIREGDTRYEWKKGLSEKMSDLHKQADDLGTPVVPFRRFALLTGFKLPKTFNLSPGIDYNRAPRSVSKPAAKETKKDEAAAEKKADEKKADEKKDDSDK